MTLVKMFKKGLPNDSPLGRFALELAGVPLLELRWALVWGTGGRGSQGSFATNLSFRFGYIQIHASVGRKHFGFDTNSYHKYN